MALPHHKWDWHRFLPEPSSKRWGDGPLHPPDRDDRFFLLLLVRVFQHNILHRGPVDWGYGFPHPSEHLLLVVVPRPLLHRHVYTLPVNTESAFHIFEGTPHSPSG